MLRDVVVDTNVWAHADNPTEQRQADAVAFLAELLDGDAAVCVDPGFSMVESENKSKIGHEYLEHLAALPFASATLAALSNSGRVSFVATGVPDRVRRVINRFVHDSSDRVFVKVAHNSESGVLCSHDYRHLPPNARVKLRTCQVQVLSAAETRTHM